MAGIGFELSKLTHRDNLIDMVGAFLHTALAALGPWLFTVVSLAIITVLAEQKSFMDSTDFRTIVVYNFSVSLVLASPIFMVATRVLSDAIHARDVTSVPALLYKCLSLVLVIHIPVVLVWYGSGLFALSPMVKLMAGVNVFLIAMVWVLTVFIMGLKDYVAVSKSFLYGYAIALLLTWVGPKDTGWLLVFFNIGMVTIIALLLARIMAEYPYRIDARFLLIPQFKRYWPLALGGLLYNAAIWVDKWILWFAPEATQLGSGMRIFPDYDQSMYVAILLTVPSFVLFVFSVETHFFRRYQQFFGDILNHMPLSRILKRKAELVASVQQGAWHVLLCQIVLTALGLVLAGDILGLFNAQTSALPIFRFGVAGAFFHVLMLLATIILSYFDCRKQTMWVFAIFFCINVVGSFVSLQIGFHSYGMGYFLASLMSFMAALVLLFSHLRNLTYHTFITNNLSVEKA